MTGIRRPTLWIRSLLLGVMTCAVVVFVPSVASARDHGHHHHGDHHQRGILFVSPGGTAGRNDASCDTAAYSTIQSAVDAAASGGAVVVCPGTYTEDVVISQPLKLIGRDGATIQGAPTSTIMCDQLGPTGPGSAPCLAGITIKSGWVQVSGLTVTGAIGEGILATGSLQGGSISNVVIRDNHVTGNDLGGIPPTTSSPYPQCAEVGQVPGDCGEGIHLMGAYDSVVTDNLINGNSGGVLLTDEFGPTHDNLVEGNVITGNPFDCGVTVPGHNPIALDAKRQSPAGRGGRLRQRDPATGSPTTACRARARECCSRTPRPAPPPTTTSSRDNYLAGNELSGVTMHAHTLAPGKFEDLSGNKIVQRHRPEQQFRERSRRPAR